jgi:hypothetical protein
LLLLCLIAGALLRRVARVPDQAHQAPHAMIVHLSLPAATLHHWCEGTVRHSVWRLTPRQPRRHPGP